jgi:hypothetical protein
MARNVKRWIGVCEYLGRRIDLKDGATIAVPPEMRGVPMCKWNERKVPVLHPTPGAAVREAREHGAREVTVERVYTLASERIVS